MAIVWGLAIGYDRVEDLPQAIAIFNGIKPVVAILTLQATWKLGKSALKNSLTGAAGIAAIGLFGVLGINTLLVLLLAGFGVMVGQNWRLLGRRLPILLLPRLELPGLAILPIITSHPAWLDVFTIFLKIGATLYGGGYVLLAFLQPELVDRTHWLTSTQLLDAIAIGQVTPGPLFTTATFHWVSASWTRRRDRGDSWYFSTQLCVRRSSHPLGTPLATIALVSGVVGWRQCRSMGRDCGCCLSTHSRHLIRLAIDIYSDDRCSVNMAMASRSTLADLRWRDRRFCGAIGAISSLELRHFEENSPKLM